MPVHEHLVGCGCSQTFDTLSTLSASHAEHTFVTVQVKGLVKSTEAQEAEITQFQNRTLDMLIRLEDDEREKLRWESHQ